MHLVFYFGSKKSCEKGFSGMSLAEEVIMEMSTIEDGAS
jgi:hypothetical protein